MALNTQQVLRFQLVELVLANGSAAGDYLIPDVPNLRDAHIMGLEIYNANQIATGPSGDAVAAAATLANTYLSLEDYDSKLFLNQHPATALNYDSAAGRSSTVYKKLVGQRVNWPKCYVTYKGGALGAATAVLIGVYYHYGAKDLKKLQTPFREMK